MTPNVPKLKRKRRTGRPPKSGAFSPICRREFLDEYPEIRRYIQDARDGLVDDQCRRAGVRTEDELPTAARLAIDRQVSKLSLSRQIEVYIMRHGLLQEERLKREKILEVEPIAGFWLNLQNSLDRGLMSLGLTLPKEAAVPIHPLDLARRIDEEKREKAAALAREEGAGEKAQPEMDPPGGVAGESEEIGK